MFAVRPLEGSDRHRSPQMIRRLCVALTLTALLVPISAFGQTVLILDDTTATTDAQVAAERLGYEVNATRNIAGFLGQYEEREEWDLIIVDVARLVFTASLLEPIQEHLDNGGPVLVSYGNMDGNALVRDAFGLACIGDAPSATIATTPADGYDIFTFSQDLPSPFVGLSRYADDGDQCESADDGIVLARFDSESGGPAVVTSHDNQVMYTGVVYDSLRASATDADGDGLSDVSELIENQILALIDMQTPGLVVYGDHATPEIDAWAAELELEVFRPADQTELDALIADDDYYALYISYQDITAADPALQTTIDTARAGGTPVLFFSSDFDASAGWRDYFGLTVTGDSDTAVSVAPGESGLLRTLFNQPNAVGGLAITADGAGDSVDVITASGALAPVAVIGGSSDTIAVADLDGGLLVGTFLPSEVGGSDSDGDGLTQSTEFLENAVAFTTQVEGQPFALLLTDAAANGLESEMDEAARRMGWYPLWQLQSAEAAATLDSTDVEIVLVENVGEDTAPFTGAAFLAALDAWVDDNGLVVAAANLDALTDWHATLGITVGDDFAAPRSISRDPTNLGRLFAIPSRVPDDLAGATSTIADYGDELILADVGAVAARFGDDDAAIVTTHNMNVIVNGFAPHGVGQDDTDSDRRRDIQQLLVGQMTAVNSPQSSLILDDDDSVDSLFGEAAQRAGLRAVVTSTPADFVAAYDAGEFQQVAIDSSLTDALVDPLTWARVLDWTSETRGMTVAFSNFDAHPDAAAYFGFTAADAAARNTVLEPADDASDIFRAPTQVPNPIARTAPIYSDGGDTLTPDEAVPAAVYLFNTGPVASVLAFSGTVAVNAFPPRELADSDLNLDGIRDRVGLFTNEMIRTGRVPVPIIGGPYTVDEGESVTIDVSGSFDPFGETLEFAWDFDGDGDFDDDEGATTTVSAVGFDGPDSTSVSVRIRNESGLAAISHIEIPVENVAPTISAGSDRVVNQGDSASFNVTVNDVDEDTHLIVWDFGDGNTSTANPTMHSYPALGVYTVTVTVTDDDGGEATDVFSVTYQNVAPAIEIGGYAAINEGDTVEVSAEVSDPGDDPITVTWDFGDGLPGATGLTASRTYPDDGRFTIRATAADDNGGERSDSTSLIVNNVAPIITSSPPTVVSAEGTYAYDVTVTDPGDDTISYELVSAPDGMTVSADGEIRWTPGAVGFEDVTVELSIDDGDGGEDTQEWSITISFGDSDDGGAPDICELAFGFDTGDPDDDASDPDEDGLTVAEECIAGSDPTVFSGPEAPVLISPIDNVTWRQPFLELVTQNVADPDGDFVTYDFQIFTDEDLSELFAESLDVDEIPAGETTTTLILELTEDTLYYWRARGVAEDVTGPWSEAQTFIFNQRNAAPGRPTPISPLGYASENPPILRVGNAIEPEFEEVVYDFEVFNGTSVREDLLVSRIEGVEEGDSGETSVTLDVTLEEGSNYTWRARARDASGGSGPYALVTFIVDVDNSPPTMPEIVAPDPALELTADGAVDLQWTNSVDADGDRIQYFGEIAEDEDFEVTLRTFRAEFDPVNSTTTATVPAPLEPETTYHWRVAATDGRFVSDFDVSTFQTVALFENTAPTAPTPVAPLAGTTFESGEPVELIVDNAIDPDANDVTYQFQIALDVDMRLLEDCPPVGNDGCAEDGSYCCQGSTITLVPEGDGSTSVVHPALNAVNYFWRARAYDGVVFSPWSSINGFTVEDDFVLPDPDLDADTGTGGGDVGVDTGEVGPSGPTTGQLGGGGGCSTSHGGTASWLGVLGLAALLRRRRR